MGMNLLVKKKAVNNYEMVLNTYSDYSKAFLQINKLENPDNQEDKYPEKEDILEFLEDSDINFGIISENIDNLVSQKDTNNKILVAKQLNPQSGKDSKIEYTFPDPSTVSFKEDEFGNIDFKELHWFTQVKEGDILAKKIPATIGKDGKNIKGEIIEGKAGKDIPLKYGKNVEVTEDGMYLKSTSHGRLEINDDKILVNEILEIEGDVDVSVGNFDFNGDVIVKGDIKSGYTITTAGSLEVRGMIEASNISVGKDLIVRGGIQGNLDTAIEVEGKMVCKFIENANIICHSNIVADFIVHSNTYCGGSITLNSKKSMLSGGKAIARDFIVVNTVGSSLGTKTDITLGLDVRKLEEIEEKKEIIEANMEMMQELQITINTGKELLQRGVLDDVKKIEFVKSLNKFTACQQSIDQLEEEIEAIQLEMKQFKFCFLQVKDKMYPGTTVTIFSQKKYIKDYFDTCKVFLKDNEITIQEG